jgi:hypothetical protein
MNIGQMLLSIGEDELTGVMSVQLLDTLLYYQWHPSIRWLRIEITVPVV